MSLAAGTRLGPYEVIAPLGSGGMGEVYRARDTRLDRDVAVKVLPGHLASDPLALERFEREAKAVAALSHPNILAIHDFGRDDGTAYAVTELLDGETLRQRLGSGALPVKKALQIAADLALGLAAAHDRGIVHRDLKPENVFLTADGQVKILDFGLAKSVVPAAGSGTSTGQTPADAATELVTDPGTVLGTVGYMSPEQIRGRQADPRSDVFSLGCVLYEMLTGRRPFQRETAPETMTAVLREDAPDLASTGATVPAALEDVVRHCLEKRPEDRFQSARDLAFALRSQGAGQTTSGRATVVAPDEPRRRPRLALAGLALAAVIVAAFVAGRLSGSPAADGAAAIASFEQVTDTPGLETRPTLSPDGRSLVYEGNIGGTTALYLLQIGARRPQRLGVEAQNSDRMPAFSPDGEHLAFRSERDGGGIFIMTSTGESARRLTDFGFFPSWSPDGSALVLSPMSVDYPTDVGARTTGLSVVNAATGGRREIPTSAIALQPAWSPNGHRVAYWGLRGDSGQRDIWTVAADGSEGDAGGRSVTDDGALDWNPVWSPDGRYLYYSSNRGGTMNLWRIPIDERSGETLGDAEPMTTPALWSGGFSFNRDGTLMAYASLDWRSTLYRVGFDPVAERLTGPPEPIRRSTRPIRDHELSPDGQWVAFMETGGQEDLFVAKTDGSEYRRLTDDVFRDRAPVWSPDGTRLAYYSDRGGDYRVWTIRPDGSGATELGGLQMSNFPTWSPDGTRIAVSDTGATDWEIAPVDPADGNPTTMTAPPSGSFWPFSWSASNRILGRLAGSLSTSELTIYDLSSGTYQEVPGTSSPAWVVGLWLDEQRLIVRDNVGISVVHLDGRRTRVLDVGGYYVGRSVGISHDHRWITYTETGTQGDVWLARFQQ